jgi:hypothetical protein
MTSGAQRSSERVGVNEVNKIGALLAAVAAVALALSCQSKKRGEPPSIESLLAKDPAPITGARCMHVATASGEIAPLRIAVVLGAGVSIDWAAAALEPARRLLRDNGVALVAAPGPIERIDDRYLLGGSIEGLEKAIAQKGIDPADVLANTAEVRRLVAAEVSEPLSRLLGERARDAGVIDLVFVERIASPLSPVQLVVKDLVGLTLSPMLPRGSTELARTLRTPDKVPTVMVSTRELERLPPEARRTVVAHEIGHALGLEHQGGSENLMSQKRHDACVPGLNPDQHKTLGLGARRLTVQYLEVNQE